MREYWSCADMSDRMTLSPSFRPSVISIALTEARPNFTWTREASFPSASRRKSVDWLLGCDDAGRLMKSIRQAFQFDVAVTVQIRHRATEAPSGTSTVAGPVDNRRVDPRDMPGNNAVSGINQRFLADQNILRLSLGNLQSRHELPGLSNLGKNVAGFHALPHLQRHFLHAAIQPVW